MIEVVMPPTGLIFANIDTVHGGPRWTRGDVARSFIGVDYNKLHRWVREGHASPPREVVTPRGEVTSSYFLSDIEELVVGLYFSRKIDPRRCRHALTICVHVGIQWGYPLSP